MTVATGEPKTTTQGTPETPSSDGKGGSTSKTYTDAEYQKAISDERAVAGREKKALEKQLSDAKKASETSTTQLAEKDTAITEIQGKIEKLEAELEDMAKDDPDRQKYLKKIKALEGFEKDLKSEKSKLDTEIESLKPDIEEARELRRTKLMGKIAGEFTGGDMDTLRRVCDRTKVPNTEEEVRGVAESLGWVKTDVQETKEEETKSPPHADSGKNNGGSINYDDLSPREKIEQGLKQKQKK